MKIFALLYKKILTFIIPVKLYYERREVKEEFTEVLDGDLPEEWRKKNKLK
jgi:hypothetical protein